MKGLGALFHCCCFLSHLVPAIWAYTNFFPARAVDAFSLRVGPFSFFMSAAAITCLLEMFSELPLGSYQLRKWTAHQIPGVLLVYSGTRGHNVSTRGGGSMSPADKIVV